MADDISEEEWGGSLVQKPGPLRRILNENGARCLVQDKENTQALTKLKEKRLAPSTSNSKEKLVDSLDIPSPEALSSTLAVQQPSQGTAERRPILFSTHNLSAISLLANTANVSASPQDSSRYRTPKRRDVFEASNCHTPKSGSSKSDSSGRRTKSSNDSKVSTAEDMQLSLSSGSKGMSTPGSSRSSPFSSRSSGVRFNPFESHNTADMLHLPTMSPGLFATTISPSCEESTVNGQFWNIEQQAELYPVHISDDSPLKQSILYKYHRKEAEERTQEQIDTYFSEYHDITSPPDLPPTGALKLDTSADTSYTQPDTAKSSKWTQTCLTLPPVLPLPVENVLRQYGLIMNIDVDTEEGNSLSNSTLRRKLFNAENEMLSDSSSEEDTGSPDKVLTPGKVMRTPVMTKTTNITSAQWSSSPLRRVRTSFSPPGLNSPIFSPITKESSRRFCETSNDNDDLCEAGGGDPSKRTDKTIEETESSQLQVTVNMESADSFQSFHLATEVAFEENFTTEDEDQGLCDSLPQEDSGRTPWGCDRQPQEDPGRSPGGCDWRPLEDPGGSPGGCDWRPQKDAGRTPGGCDWRPLEDPGGSPGGCDWRPPPDTDTTSTSYITVSGDRTWGSPNRDSQTGDISLVAPGEGSPMESTRGGVEDASSNSQHIHIQEDSSAGGLTLPTLAEEDSNMNAESRADTGYTTNTASSIHPSNLQEDSTNPSLIVQDSGVSTSQPPSLTVSMILPNQQQNQVVNVQQQVLMSYDAEGNDISVGFPLGSSTPTRN